MPLLVRDLPAFRGVFGPETGTVVYETEADLAAAMQGKDGIEAGRALLEDERKFIDLEGSSLFLTEEHEIF